jgi:hypothetical protein
VTVSGRFNLAHATEEGRDASVYLISQSNTRVKGVPLSTLIAKLVLQDFKNRMLRMGIEYYEYKVSKDISTQISLINVELRPRNCDIKEFCQGIVDQRFSIEYFIGDIPFGFYPLINVLDQGLLNT